MDWQKIFTESQVPIFLLAISYFIKRYYDLKTKKVELNHSLFQQNRISAINNFYSNYAKVEFMWHELSINDILEYKILPKEIDKVIWPPLNDLKKSVLELKVYLTLDNHSYFQKLLDNFLLVNNNLIRNYFDYDRDKTVTNKKNSFSIFKEKIVKENNNILDQVSIKIRKSFNQE